MNTHAVVLTVLLTVFTSAPVLHGALVSEDSFITGETAYIANTSLDGQNPAVTGFSGAWTAGGACTVAGTGLTHSGQVYAAGGCVVVAANTDAETNAVRGIANPPVPLCYLSFLARFEDDSVNTTSGNQGMWGAGGERRTGMLNNKLKFQGHTTTTLGYADNVTYLFVVRIEHNVDGTNERMLQYYFRDDDPAPVPDQDPGILTPATYRGSYDSTNANIIGNSGTWNAGFGFYVRGAADWSSGTISFDELRVGDAWEDVVNPLPEPALLAAGALALSALVRR